MFFSLDNHRIAAIVLISIVAGWGPESRAQETEQAPGRPLQHENMSLDEVRTKVWPILRERCLNCHHVERSDGGLRLDSLPAMRSGGHTTNPILGTDESPIETSELLRRVKSDDEQYQMPQAGPPLSADQIEILEQWIASGSPWPAEETLRLKTSLNDFNRRDESKRFTKTFERFLDGSVPVQRRVRELPYLLIVFLVLVLIVRNRQRRFDAASDSVPRSWLDRIATSLTGLHLLAMLQTIAIFTIVLHHVRYAQDAATQLQRARANPALSDQSSRSTSHVRSKTPIHWLKHPPRLGGVYYRGNDERNGNLFNGGYYRTATMTLSLRDADQRVLQWDSEAHGDKLLIHVDIQRAPFTTPALFSSEILARCALVEPEPEHPDPENAPANSIDIPSQRSVPFTELVPQQRWQASISIGDLDPLGNGHFEGKINIVNGQAPHFAIEYDIDLENHVVMPQSTLTMGVILLPGSIVIPQESDITLAEWFSFLPIPEITEPNSEDPELLGIPEHTIPQPNLTRAQPLK